MTEVRFNNKTINLIRFCICKRVSSRRSGDRKTHYPNKQGQIKATSLTNRWELKKNLKNAMWNLCQHAAAWIPRPKCIACLLRPCQFPILFLWSMTGYSTYLVSLLCLLQKTIMVFYETQILINHNLAVVSGANRPF